MNNDLEQHLQSFRLKEPSPGLEQAIIAAAEKRWSEQAEIPFSAAFVYGVKIFFTAAAIILVSVMTLNLLSFPKAERNADKYKAEIEQLATLGISKSNAAVIIAAMENGPRKINLNRQQLFKGDIL